jgi:plastocyanin
MKLCSLIRAMLFFCLATSRLHAQATVEGTVQLPKPSPDIGINQRYQADLPIAPTNPPAAVVYLEGNRPVQLVAHSTAQMAQKGMTFAPDLVAILVGSTVEFPNLDDTYHNVFSYSKAKRFDLGRYRRDEKPGAVVFDKPGAVTIHCDIHERMRGTVLVLDTPYFVKTDAQGRYRLEHLFAGNFTLKAWVTEREVRERPVELRNGGVLHVDFPAK